MSIPDQPNFMTRYWRGEVPLPISFWLINSGASIAVGIAINVLIYSVRLNSVYHPVPVFIGMAGGWGIAALAQVWQGVGLWRSAGAYLSRNRGGWRIWAYVARIWVIVSLAGNVPDFLTSGFPQVAEALKILFANDPDIQDYEIALSEDGQEIHVTGGFKYGLAKDLRRLLEHAPSVRVVVLESSGGRIREAQSVYNLLVEKRLSTAVNTECDSACALAFTAGENRWLGMNGQIGFHAPSAVGVSHAEAGESVQNFERQISRDIGVPASFFKTVDQVGPKDIWYPSRDELIENKVLTARFPQAPSSLREFEDWARDLQVRVGKKLPYAMNRFATVSGFAVDGNVLSYKMTIDPLKITRSEIWDMAGEIENQAVEQICSSQGTYDMVSMGVFYRYLFFHGTDVRPTISFDITRC